MDEKQKLDLVVLSRNDIDKLIYMIGSPLGKINLQLVIMKTEIKRSRGKERTNLLEQVKKLEKWADEIYQARQVLMFKCQRPPSKEEMEKQDEELELN